jgi:hypothetical protein
MLAVTHQNAAPPLNELEYEWGVGVVTAILAKNPHSGILDPPLYTKYVCVHREQHI